jgi:hypothetical protein
MIPVNLKSLSENEADPLEAIRFYWFFASPERGIPLFG